MKTLFMICAVTATSLLARAESIQFPFIGAGHCKIESNPCSNGKPISCYAAGSYSGNCSLEANGDIWTVTCIAYGDGIRRVTQSCHKP